MSQAAYNVTGGLLGTPESGYQAVRDVAGEAGEAFVSRDQKATSAVVGLTNQKAASNPGALEELAKSRGSSAAGLSLAEARRRNAENVKVLEAETDLNAKPLARLDAVAAARAGTAPKAPPPKSGSELAKRVKSLPKQDQDKANEALTMKKSNPDYEKAQAWLSKRGLR
jgi:alpha-D-ribose 1-methylphosphonate 5-triphosphate synthase subunit PhnG